MLDVIFDIGNMNLHVMCKCQSYCMPVHNLILQYWDLDVMSLSDNHKLAKNYKLIKKP